MKTRCLCSYLWPRGEHHPTPPRGQPQGRHMTRRGDILQDAISGSRPPRESTGPLYTQPGPPSTVRDSQVSKSDPLGGIQTPLSEVRTTYSKVPGQGIPWPMSRTGNTCLGFDLCASAPCSGGGPMLPRGLSPMT
jgi:hypothetical protein